MLITPQKISELKDIFEKDRRVIFAYLFGSVAQSKHNKLSDIDIAVYIDDTCDVDDTRRDLIITISYVFKTYDVDVVILNVASPLMVHSVVRTGKLLLSKDEKLRISFIHKNLKEFMDMEYYRDRYQKALSQRIESGRYGF